jgi:hypothetical protein
MLIRNLRKANDYSKAIMTQDELLRLATNNDANIAAARAGIQRGEIEPLSQEQQKSPAELQADLALQEQTALNNLLRIFQYREAGPIVAALSNDEVFTLNQLFPQIERDLKSKFAANLISPTFFLEYLRKFKEEFEASKGVSTNLSNITNKFNELTDNINDIRAILPTRNQLGNLMDFVENELDNLPRIIIIPLLERIKRLEEVIPTKEELQKVGENNELMQFELMNMLQNLTADMPTQNQLNMIIEDIRSGRISNSEAIQKIENALSGISENQLDMLEEIKREIYESSPAGIKGGSNIEIVAQVLVGTRMVPTLAVAKKILASGNSSSTQNVYIIGEVGNQILDLTELKAILKSDENFRNWFSTNVGTPVTIKNLKDYILANSLQAETPVAMSDATSKETFSTEKTGFGLKSTIPAFRPAFRKIKKNKIGDGLKYDDEPTYRQFGKYVININQLKDRDILNVKFPSLGRIPQFKPTPISDILKEFILELLETGKVSHRIYDQIPIDERQLFEKIATGAGILNTLKIKRTISNEDKEDNNRFNLLKGEYLAGNNSVSLLKELRKLVVKFMSQGKISKHDGMNLLIELS